MKKLPVQLITNLVSAKAGSPLIWDGYDVVVSQNDDYNIKSLSDTLKSLSSSVSSIQTSLTNQQQTLNTLSPTVNMLVQTIPTIQTRLAGIEDSVSGVNGVVNRMTTVEARLANAEADINGIIAGGGGGSSSGGGGSLSTTFSNILTALNNGTYITGDNSAIKVEKLPTGSNAGSYRISFIGDLSPTTIIPVDNYLNVRPLTSKSYSIQFVPSELRNFIGASKGLQVDPAFTDKLFISPTPTLVKGDGSTINVSYDPLAGSFTVRSLVSQGTGGAYSPDGTTIVSNNGTISVASSILSSSLLPFSYVSGNYYGSAAITSQRLSTVNESSIYGFLPQDVASNKSVIPSTSFSPYLKTAVFNVSNLSMLSGNIYFISDFNSVGTVINFTTPAQSIGTNANLKNLVFDLDIFLRMEQVSTLDKRYGTNFPFTDGNLIFPFYLYWLTNTVKSQTTLYGGEVLRFGEVTGDGYGALARHKDRVVVKTSDLVSKALDSGILQLNFMIGFKVASSSDALFTSSLLNRYLVEPKVSALVTYL